jgi:hypothetical protein
LLDKRGTLPELLGKVVKMKEALGSQRTDIIFFVTMHEGLRIMQAYLRIANDKGADFEIQMSE